MAEKTVTVVVCDLHSGRNIPATQKRTIDVCDNHAAQIDLATSGAEPETFPCPHEDCPKGRNTRPFRTKGGLTKHLTDTHGEEPKTARAQERRANGNGPQIAAVPEQAEGDRY